LSASYERYGERDPWLAEWISRLHREWGKGCPCVDLDDVCPVVRGQTSGLEFPVLEYGGGRSRAIIEYKYKLAFYQNTVDVDRDYNLRALRDLADSSKKPFFIVYYWREPDGPFFVVQPANEYAREYCRDYQWFSEHQYVKLMYKLRGTTAPYEVLATRKTDLPGLDVLLPIFKEIAKRRPRKAQAGQQLSIF